MWKVSDDNIKLVINDLYRLKIEHSVVWINFTDLRDARRSCAFTIFSLFYLYTGSTLSLFVVDIKKDLVFGFFRYSECLCFGFIKLFSICLVMEWSVYWIYTLAISEDCLTVYSFLHILIIFPIHSQVSQKSNMLLQKKSSKWFALLFWVSLCSTIF